MNISKNVVAVLLIMLFLATSALAEEGHRKMDHSNKMMEHSKMNHNKLMDHKAMMNNNMTMMKEFMGIVKNLKHTPTAAQSKRLTMMMKNLDKMKKMHNTIHEMEDKNDGMIKNPCAMKH